MRNILLVFSFIACSTILFGQKRDNRFEGYIILNDGTKKELMIEVEDPALPWTFQQDVRTFDKSLLGSGKIKKEQKAVLDPLAVKEYGYDGRKFISVNYYIKGEGEDNILKSAYGRFKGERPSDFFSEVVRDGKVRMLRFYIPPVISDEDYENDALVREKEENAKNAFDILLVRDGFKPESIDAVSFKAFFSDCEALVKKYDTGKYTIKPGKSLKARFKGDKLPGTQLEQAAVQVMTDYEAFCK